MNLTRKRIHSIGWVFVLTICAALTVALTLRVNAVKGQVREAESRIVSLRHDVQFLEVEFQTRANQQQLAALNSVEFGYVAPRADQYIEGERQLASLGMPRGPGAPSPIRMAVSVSKSEAAPFIAMVSPITGKSAAEKPRAKAKSPETKGRTGHGDKDTDSAGDIIGGAISDSKVTAKLARVEFAQGSDE